MSEQIVKAEHLVKRIGGITAVDGVSFSIEPGQIFGYLGPNGAGKTTTISILSTYLPATSGDALVGGFSVRREPLKVKEIIGVVPQEIALYPTLTAMQNLRFCGKMYNLQGSMLDGRCREMLELVKLWERRDSRIEEFSGGMKRRINLAAGMLHRPRFLLLDEPTVGIDPQSRERIFDTIFKIRDDGTTVLYTSHYMEEVELLCDHIAIMDRGKIIAAGTLKDLLKMLGEGGMIELEVSPPGCASGLEEAISRLEDVTGARREENRLFISSVSSARTLAPVMKLVEAGGCEVSSLELYSPNLEKLFIHLTGKELRE